MMNMIEWVNIPASYLLIAYLGSLGVLAGVHPRKKAWPRRLAAGLILALVYSGVLFLNPRAEGLRFLLCMATIWGGMLLFFRSCLNIAWRDAAYFTVRAFFVGDFAASLFWQLAYYLMGRWEINDKLLVSIGVLVPGCALYFGAIWLIERQFRRELSELQIQRKDLAIVLFIGVFFYFNANISYVLTDSPFSSSILAETYTLRTLTEFGAVAILLAYHVRIIDLLTKLRMQAMQNAWKLQEDHYKIYEASIELVNQKYHDLKHQLHLLRDSVSTDEKMRYLEEMERELSVYEAQNKTGNDVLDTILTAKGMECQRAGICLTCVVDGKALSWMSPLDINALFGNILDNAMECELRIADVEKRLIHISVARQKAYIQIRVRNICEEAIVFEGGLPMTTKEDKRYHGFGTASIHSIVEKYQGSLLMKCEDGWFEVSILFPLNSEKMVKDTAMRVQGVTATN